MKVDTTAMRRHARMTNLNKEADMLAMADEIDRLYKERADLVEWLKKEKAAAEAAYHSAPYQHGADQATGRAEAYGEVVERLGG